MKDPLTLIIPRVHPSLNKILRMHWGERKRQQDVWDREVFAALWSGTPARRFNTSAAVVRIAYHFKNDRRRDKDNYAPKFLMDALRHNNVIADDDTEHVDVEWDIVTGARGDHTVVTITPEG